MFTCVCRALLAMALSVELYPLHWPTAQFHKALKLDLEAEDSFLGPTFLPFWLINSQWTLPLSQQDRHFPCTLKSALSYVELVYILTGKGTARSVYSNTRFPSQSYFFSYYFSAVSVNIFHCEDLILTLDEHKFLPLK